MIRFKSGFVKTGLLRRKQVMSSLLVIMASIPVIASSPSSLADFQFVQKKSDSSENITLSDEKNVNRQPENGSSGSKTPDRGSKNHAQAKNCCQMVNNSDRLPFPVRKMRELILKAALSGNIEKLRPLIGHGDDVTMLSIEDMDEDPIDFLKSLSGDREGYEILAILAEILESDHVLINRGSAHEMYVWPHFFVTPLEELTPAQKVEMYRLLTHGDYRDMEVSRAYIFYRVGITPRGRWHFFVAGD